MIHESEKGTDVKHCSEAIELLEMSGLRLRNLLFKMTHCEDTADDLMQELFLRLAGSHGFSCCRNKFAYAWRTAVNLAKDHHRKKRFAVSVDERNLSISAILGPLDELIRDEHLQIILHEILRMKPPGRDVLIMRHLEQRPFSEIAAALEKKENYVRSVASKALTKLRGNLNGQFDIELQEQNNTHSPKEV